MTEGRSVKEREPFNVLDMSFASGPLERIFGPAASSFAHAVPC